MLLTFVRHAEASSNTSSDFNRELTKHGQQQAAQVAAFLSSVKNPPQVILSSPVVRAHQTAKSIQKRIPAATFLEQPWLACGMNPEICFQELRAFGRFKHILLVGHEPDFSTTIASLLGLAHSGNLQICKASICALEATSFSSGSAILNYLLYPDHYLYKSNRLSLVSNKQNYFKYPCIQKFFGLKISLKMQFLSLKKKLERLLKLAMNFALLLVEEALPNLYLKD